MTKGAPVDVTALEALLRELTSAQEELALVLGQKLDAMRKADTAAMQSATAREGFLLDRLGQLDMQRHAVLNRVVEAVGLPRSASMTLSQIAARLDERTRGRLTKLMQELRERMLRVAEANRVIALVSGEMLAHYRNVFSALTRGSEESTVYTRGGRISGEPMRVLDAVG